MDRVLELLDAAAKKKGMQEVAGIIYPHLKMDSAAGRLYNELAEINTYKLGLRTALQIMKITGDLEALDRIEAIFNRVAFVLPRPGDGLPMMEMVSRMSKEFGESVAVLAEGMRDGKLTRKERSAGVKELVDLVRICMKLKAYLERG
ncbi:MAG: phage regulatory CII family protein [bacterium]